MDYQPEIIETVFEQDRRLIELNARALADLAVRFEVPVILSTVKNLEPDARPARVERSRRAAEEMQNNLVDRLRRSTGGRRKAKKTLKMISRLRNFAGYR